MAIFNKHIYPNVSINLGGNLKPFDTSDVKTIIDYNIDIGNFGVCYQTKYILKDGRTLTHRQYLKEKMKKTIDK